MTDIELEILSALEAEASEYPLPPELAERTLEAAGASPAPRPIWLNHPRAHRLLGRRRWAYVLAAAAVIPLLFLVGTHEAGTRVAPGASATKAPSHFAGSEGELNLNPNQVAGSIVAGEPGNPGQGTAVPAAPAQAAPTPPASSTTPGTPAPSGFQQSIVRTASVSVQVPKGKFSSTWSQALGIAGRFGGLVSDSNAQTVNGRLASGTLTLQVPSSSLDQAMAALGDLGTVTDQTSSSQDQSGQVANDAAQLTALQAEEAEYLQLLPGAKSTADILAIEQPLTSVEQQIQTLQASQAYLQKQVAMATINAALAEPGSQPPVVKVQGRIGKAWHQARDGATTVFAGFIVALGYLLAPALLLLVAWAVVRRLRRHVV